ncbi:MAG: hypothetical protein M5U34_15740 [Chloroflexi bacterium]|nr:hypothetical protein [Chloroflexota bacterium]
MSPKTEAGPQTVPSIRPRWAVVGKGARKWPPKKNFPPAASTPNSTSLTRSQAGRRSVTKTERKRGRYIQSRLPQKIASPIWPLTPPSAAAAPTKNPETIPMWLWL